VVVSAGTGAGDPVANLAADDSAYFRVNGAKQGKKRIADWYGRTTVVPSGAKKLTVVYNGSATTSVTQTLYVYRFSTSSWVKVGSLAVGNADATMSWSTTTPSNFVSSTNDVRVRVSATAGTAFTSRGDLMRVTIDY
jgi:hypothetical protein